MMIRYLPLLLLVSACQTADGTAGLVGPPGPQGPAGEPGPKGDTGAPGPGAKQLHLIVAETGEDLGLFIGHAGVAYNERAAAVTYYTSNAQLLYSAADCKGAPMMAHIGVALRPYAARGPNGTLYRVEAKAAKMARVSTFLDGRCVNAEVNQDAVPFQDTGIPIARFTGDEFAIELR